MAGRVCGTLSHTVPIPNARQYGFAMYGGSPWRHGALMVHGKPEQKTMFVRRWWGQWTGT